MGPPRPVILISLVLCLVYPADLYPSTLGGTQDDIPDPNKTVVYTSISYSKGSSLDSPKFEFLSPKGVKIIIPEVEPLSSPHHVIALLSLNNEIVGENADWRGEMVVHSGMEWSFILPEGRVEEGDRINYWVKIQHPEDPAITEGEYKGSYHVHESNPHSGVSSSPTQGLSSGSISSESENPESILSSLNTKIPDDLFSQFSSSIKGNGDTDLSNIFSNFGCPNCHSAGDFLEYSKKGSTQTAQALPAQATQEQVVPARITLKPSITSERCRTSPSVVNDKAMCAGEVFRIYKFISDQHLGANPEGSFTVYGRENINDEGDGVVSCHPTTLELFYGPDAVDKDLNLELCTAVTSDLCNYSPASYLITPPVLGCRMSTKPTDSFLFGSLTVRAKLPAGDWIVSEITLEPKSWVYGQRSGRIILARSRGNSNLQTRGGADYSSKVVEAGIELGNGTQMFTKGLDTPLTDEVHDFKLIWTPDKLQFLVDDTEIGQINPQKEGLDPLLRGSKLAPFDKEFYLQFGIHAGGNRDFPDDLSGKPWKNNEPKNKLKFWQARENWLPTWTKEKSSLRIIRAEITALEE